MTPAELLVTWRATERRHAHAAMGSAEATALHAEMRRLMDEYEWAVRGRIPSQRRADADAIRTDLS
jgi:hypothetical protein